MLTRVCQSWLGLLCAVVALCIADAVAAQEQMRAKIGVHIQSDVNGRLARSKDKVGRGDKLRIFIQPESKASVYVIHTDNESTDMLAHFSGKGIEALESVVLPSETEYYEIDGLSPFEKLTIIISAKALPAIESLFDAEKPTTEEWEKIELALRKQSQVDLNERVEKPFGIAGNVRDIGSQNEQFFESLPTLIGTSLVIKRYELRVQK